MLCYKLALPSVSIARWLTVLHPLRVHYGIATLTEPLLDRSLATVKGLIFTRVLTSCVFNNYYSNRSYSILSITILFLCVIHILLLFYSIGLALCSVTAVKGYQAYQGLSALAVRLLDD